MKKANSKAIITKRRKMRFSNKYWQRKDLKERKEKGNKRADQKRKRTKRRSVRNTGRKQICDMI